MVSSFFGYQLVETLQFLKTNVQTNMTGLDLPGDLLLSQKDYAFRSPWQCRSYDAASVIHVTGLGTAGQ
jgi:hypothetical protein